MKPKAVEASQTQQTDSKETQLNTADTLVSKLTHVYHYRVF